MRSIIAVLLLTLNLMLVSIWVVVFGVLGKILPVKRLRAACSRLAENILTPLWIDLNSAILRFATPTEIIVTHQGNLRCKGWYCVISNHRSWLDILLLQKVFNRKIPVLKFFMKQSLIWKLPIAGLGCWAIDFPFMKRYSNSYLKKHPEKKGKDREITRKACQKFKHKPVAVTSFLEGTRFTQEKHDQQASPYQHLLRPYAGGLAFILYALQDCLSEIINVTIIYPAEGVNFWHFLRGKMKKVIIHYEVFPIPTELRGNYYENKIYRKQFQAWLSTKWAEKDKLLDLKQAISNACTGVVEKIS